MSIVKPKECEFKSTVLFHLEENGTVSIKKCCAKRFLPNVLANYTIEEFKTLNFSNLFKSLKGKSDGFVDIGENFSFSCGNTKTCLFPNIEIDSVQVNFLLGCNASCTFCNEGYSRSKLKPFMTEGKELYFDTLYKLKNIGLKYIKLTDAGEPLLFLNEMKQFIKSLQIGDFEAVHIITNGHNIDAELIDLIKESPVQVDLSVSLNAFNAETRKRIMGLDDYDTVVKNILQLPYCGVSFCICEENKSQLEDFIKFWESHNRVITILSSI